MKERLKLLGILENSYSITQRTLDSIKCKCVILQESLDCEFKRVMTTLHTHLNELAELIAKDTKSVGKLKIVLFVF